MAHERVDAVATELLARLTGVCSRLGAALPAAGADQCAAVDKIALRAQAAHIDIELAGTADAIDAVVVAAETAMRAVRVVNAPVWRHAAAILEEKLVVAGSTVKLEVVHPAGASTAGSILVTAACDADSASVDIVYRTSNVGVTIRRKARTATIHLLARSLCGPSALQVTLE